MLNQTSISKRALVAEDDEALRRVICRKLTQEGFTVSEAGGGLTAMQLLQKERFDIVLTDIAMPEMDGIAFIRAAREHDPDVPVVLMTGTPDVSTAIEAIELGAYRYVTKPIDMAKLVELVNRAATVGQLTRVKREAIGATGQGLGESDRAGLEVSFTRAIDTLWMAYQPIVRAADRSLFGYEALLRSQEPSLPHPGAVLDAAERLDRLVDLGRTIRSRATEPFAAAGEGTLFVNLHPRDLADDELLSEAAPLSKIASRVVLEITERASLGQISDLSERIARLRALGFRIAVDDLGAGYAGLTTFAQLEPEVAKLDMSLIRDVHRSTVKQKLVRSISALCHDLGILVVAEGVEHAAERDALVDLGCDLLQGYHLAKPGKPFPPFSWGVA